jgi:hypothetical protein
MYMVHFFRFGMLYQEKSGNPVQTCTRVVNFEHLDLKQKFAPPLVNHCVYRSEKNSIYFTQVHTAILPLYKLSYK